MERIFELAKLVELLERYGEEVQFLQSVEAWKVIPFSAHEAAVKLARDFPDTSVFAAEYKAA